MTLRYFGALHLYRPLTDLLLQILRSYAALHLTEIGAAYQNIWLKKLQILRSYTAQHLTEIVAACQNIWAKETTNNTQLCCSAFNRNCCCIPKYMD
jgi:hypothetical protein